MKLVYIDPPFDTGADFSMRVDVSGADVTKQPSILEEHAYRDTWGAGYDSYLSMMYPRLVLIHEPLPRAQAARRAAPARLAPAAASSTSSSPSARNRPHAVPKGRSSLPTRRRFSPPKRCRARPSDLPRPARGRST